MIISQNGAVDLIPEYNRALRPIFCVSEGDANSRTINLTVTSAGEVFTIPEGAEVYVAGKKQDNTIFTYQCAYSGYIVSFPVAEQMSAANGLVLCELQIVVAGDPLGSANFCYWVEPSPIANGSSSESDLNIFEQAIAALGGYDYLTGEVATLSARMDQFARLPDGSLSTAADAELADIRVEANGKTATTAGDAVREQITNMNAQFVDVVCKYPMVYTNTANQNSTAAGYFGFWFEETTYVESVLPTFTAEVGEGTAYIYRANTRIAKNVSVTLSETITFTIGQPVMLNRYLSPNEIVIIHGNADSVLRFVNNTNVPLNARISRIYAQNTTTSISSVLEGNCFAGVFTIREAKPEHLLGKTLMAVGDSLVYGHTLGPTRAWPALVGADLGMEVDNRGTNGARMANYQYNSKDNSVYQKVCVSTSEFYISTADLQAAEVIIIYAGTNDCNHSITIGDVDSTDPLEFCGAINLICQELQTRAPQSKIAFITPYKRAGVEAQCQEYIDAILAVCDKYSIPVFDNGKNGGICWSNAAITGAMALDTFHLNDAGMKYVSTKYESFIQSL